MALMDALMNKKNLFAIGINKNELFADPKAFLSENPIKMEPVKPWFLVALLVVALPGITLLSGLLIFGQFWLVGVCVAAGIAIALAVMMMVIKPQEYCLVDQHGITIVWRNKEVFAPWELFNKDGVSRLDVGVEIHVPINTEKWNLVRHKVNGVESKGHETKSHAIRFLVNKDMAAVRNAYPLTSTDFAELIRRVALTLGHQAPPPAPAEAVASDQADDSVVE